MAAWTMAKIPALMGFGRLGHSFATGTRSGMILARDSKQDSKQS